MGDQLTANLFSVRVPSVTVVEKGLVTVNLVERLCSVSTQSTLQ